MTGNVSCILSFCAFSLLAPSTSVAQDTMNFPVLGEIVRADPRLDEVIGPDARIEVISSGYLWSEGPVWVPRDGGYLLFSDIPRNSINKWVAGEGASLFLKPSGYTGLPGYGNEPGSNGLLIDPSGNLVCCEHGDRRVSLLPWDGGKRTLVDNYEGRRLNSPNDAVFKSNGDLYFTDPPYGLPQQLDDPRCELGFCGVYRLATNGVLTLSTDEMTRPNGIGFSPDEKTLYVAQSDRQAALWKAFPVRDDGTLGPGRVLYDATPMLEQNKGLPDGMTVGAAGHVFATGPGGVFVFTPDGELLGRLDTKEATANCAFGGPDGSTLFITADTYLCRVQTKTQGISRQQD